MSGGSGALPADFLSQRRVTWPGSTKVELEYVEPSFLQAAFPDNASGMPQVYTIEASTIIVRPVDNTSLTLLYFAKIAALSSGAPNNWLLTAHPDVYLFGSMVEAEMFGVNDERMGLWKARRDELFDEISILSNKAGGMRIMGTTP
jgi:hypothetical protein